MRTHYPERSLLIADDAYFVRHIIKRHLSDLQFGDVYEAENGVELLKQYALYHPDLVLMDIIMEQMNGLIALDRLLERNPHARIIIVSAVDIPDLIRECVHIGAFEFIVKPFTREKLIEATHNALA